MLANASFKNMCFKYCEYLLVRFMLIMSLNILVNFESLSAETVGCASVSQQLIQSLTLLPCVCTSNKLPQGTTGALTAVRPVVTAFAKCGKIPKCQTKTNLQKNVFKESVSKEKLVQTWYEIIWFYN